MTKSILHAIKKLLRISILILAISGAAFHASAMESNSDFCSTNCNSQLNVSLDASGYALIDAPSIWGGAYSAECFPLLDSVVVEIVGSSPVVQDVTLYGHTISTTGALLNCAMVGQNLEYNLVKYYGDGTENSCWGNILIEDKMLPNIICTDLFVECTDDLDAYELANNYNNAIPVNSDNCEIASLLYQDSEEDYDCTDPQYLRKITRVWTATDASNNQRVCTQNIFVKKANGNDFIFPENRNDLAAPSLNCVNPNLNPTYTGSPTLNGSTIVDPEICKFSYDYQDQIINTCGGSYKVIRRWTLLDWCTSEIFIHNQIIKVADKVAPTIVCPNLTEIGTVSNSCSGNVSLPAANVSDACSNFTVTTTTPLGIINGNGGSVIGLPLGDHVITYTATDECGNVSSCATTLTVIDNVPPTTICDQSTSVSLVNDGTAIIFADIFDDGSYDNCEIVNYQVRRMDNPNCAGNDATAYADFVNFSCCDLGSIVLVELKVTDAAGNSNSCMIDVEVEDKLDPVIICPLNKTITCAEDYTDLTLTGVATATDNCNEVTVDYEDIATNLDQCGVGTVSRAWTATDAQGRRATCIQTIYLVNDNLFDEADFTFPLDYNTAQCGGGDLSPDNLPSPYGHPTVNEDACDLVALTYEDLVLPIAAPACYKILRRWIIVDWCQYDANYVGPNGETPGRWEHVQVIKVTDNIAPVFTNCPSDLTVDNFENNCGATYVSLQATATDCSESLTYTYSIDQDNNGTIEQTGNGNDASRGFNNGIYNITFTATDGCGNSTDCSFLLTVQDAKKPTPVCINGLAADLMPSSGMLTIWATDFETGSSYDNCTAHEALQFSFSSDVNDVQRDFTCEDLGLQNVEIWVTDAAGNQDFCTTALNVQDNNAACAQLIATVAGTILNESGEAVEGVTLAMAGNNNTFTVTTEADGSFNFPNTATGNNYTVTPEKNLKHLNGVSTYDLVLISKHIIGSKPLDSPYKIIAADANHSETVTTLDIIHLRRLILHMDDELRSNTSWRFVPTDFVFPNPTNPFTSTFPEVISLNNLATDEVGEFVGIKIGDVNDSASPNQLLGTEVRSFKNSLVLTTENATIEAGEMLTVDFQTKDFQNILGTQFTFTFDTDFLEFEEVITNQESWSTDNFGTTLLERGILTLSWNNFEAMTLEDETILFSLKFKGKKSGALDKNISINSTKTNAESYAQIENTADIEILDVQLVFNSENSSTLQNQLFQNQPNPAMTHTMIPFELAQAGKAVLKIMDISGKIVKEISGTYSKGYHEIQLNNLQGSGVMYYQLEMQNETLTKKMILINK